MDPPISPKEQHECFHLRDADDAQLMRSFQEGCDECLNVLFMRYCKLVFAISWKILRRASEAEDIVQEVFLTIFTLRNQYDATRGSVKTWIAQFAHFKALMRRRHLNSRQLTDLEAFTTLESETSNPAPFQGVVENAALVEECLTLLDARQKRTLELIHFEGYTLVEAAAILGESLANTRNLYYRGIKALRAALSLPVEAIPNRTDDAYARSLRSIPENLVLEREL